MEVNRKNFFSIEEEGKRTKQSDTRETLKEGVTLIKANLGILERGHTTRPQIDTIIGVFKVIRDMLLNMLGCLGGGGSFVVGERRYLFTTIKGTENPTTKPINIK